jgi:hypothetical protein
MRELATHASDAPAGSGKAGYDSARLHNAYCTPVMAIECRDVGPSHGGESERIMVVGLARGAEEREAYHCWSDYARARAVTEPSRQCAPSQSGGRWSNEPGAAASNCAGGSTAVGHWHVLSRLRWVRPVVSPSPVAEGRST